MRKTSETNCDRWSCCWGESKACERKRSRCWLMEEAWAPRGRWKRGGVSWTGPGVITLIDTSPHTHAQGPRGPIRGPALQAEGGHTAGTGAAGECIRGVIALLIFVCPCVTPPDAHSPPTRTHRVRTQVINPTGPTESSVPLKAFGGGALCFTH